MAKKKRISAWGILARLGHTGDHDQDEIVQFVFDAASRVTLRRDGGEPLDGDNFLVETFEALGTTKTWPSCGSPEWERLRSLALTTVVRRLGREGLLDCLSVGSEGTPAPSDRETGEPTDGEHDGGESDTSDDTDGDDASDPRVGVQAYRAMIRRGRRNPSGWFRLVNRETPYRVIVRWAAEACPDVPTESLVALLDALREVRWWDDDGHIIGGELLRILEAELEEGCGHEQWILVVSDFERAIQRLRSVFERLCLL